MTTPEPATHAPAKPGIHVLYPNHYAWYILAATLDIIVTHQVLHRYKGSEMNQLADALIRRFDLAGMIGLKYSSIVLVVLICEFIGRRNLRVGRRLATAAVCLSALPVGIGLLQIGLLTHLVAIGVVAPPEETGPDEGEAEESAAAQWPEPLPPVNQGSINRARPDRCCAAAS